MALKEGEVPVGCVIVHRPTGRILGYGHNKTNASHNVSVLVYTTYIDSVSIKSKTFFISS